MDYTTNIGPGARPGPSLIEVNTVTLCLAFLANHFDASTIRPSVPPQLFAVRMDPYWAGAGPSREIHRPSTHRGVDDVDVLHFLSIQPLLISLLTLCIMQYICERHNSSLYECKNTITSPSFTGYVLPSVCRCPFSRAAAHEPSSTSVSQCTTSARINLSLKSL